MILVQCTMPIRFEHFYGDILQKKSRDMSGYSWMQWGSNYEGVKVGKMKEIAGIYRNMVFNSKVTEQND